MIEGPCANGKAVEMEASAAIHDSGEVEPLMDQNEQGTPRIPLNPTDAPRATVNHEDTLEVAAAIAFLHTHTHTHTHTKSGSS